MKFFAWVFGKIQKHLTGLKAFPTNCFLQSLHSFHKLVCSIDIKVTERTSVEWWKSQTKDSTYVSINWISQYSFL